MLLSCRCADDGFSQRSSTSALPLRVRARLELGLVCAPGIDGVAMVGRSRSDTLFYNRPTNDSIAALSPADTTCLIDPTVQGDLGTALSTSTSWPAF